MKNWLRQIAIAADQLLNAVCGGWADETLSSRAHRSAAGSTAWALVAETVNTLFFWQKGHCRRAYENERARRHLPPELR